MSKSIFAMVQGNVEKEIRAKEKQIKLDFLEFLNTELEKMLEKKECWYVAKRSFKLPKGESHFEWEKTAEEMGFLTQYEFDNYYGDTLTLKPTTAENEATKLISQHNKKVEKAKKEEQKKKEAIRIASQRAADKVVREILGKLRSGDYEIKKYGENVATIKVTYEKVSFEGLDVDCFKAFVGDILQNYKFKSITFGGTSNNYFEIHVRRPGAEETAE